MAGKQPTRSRRSGVRLLPEYWIYNGAKQRCTDPNSAAYKDYGARGIKFLFRNFQEFYAALGPRPDPSLTLDRRNNDGHYEPGNVRWATRKEQAANKRKPLSVTVCKHGHSLSGDNVGLSRGSNRISRRCLACHRETERIRRISNPTKTNATAAAESSRKYYLAHRAEILNHKREYREQNRDKIAAYKREYKARRKGRQ